ncbi:MAG: DNA repair protein RecO [Coriobacteriales bacterium]|jgi:DNA repair protein RecO|nr:DNA repair protein RecO [Coriobacteriales bacterium]
MAKAASKIYKATGVVLKKTKLGETDLIITLLDTEGKHLQAVVKGARKPGSRIGCACELYSHCELTLNQGKSLDIVTDARLISANRACCSSLMQSFAAAVVAEFVEKCSRDGGSDQRILPLCLAALTALGKARDADLEFLVAASLLKIIAQIGFRPELEQCAICGDSLTDISDSSIVAKNESGVGTQAGANNEELLHFSTKYDLKTSEAGEANGVSKSTLRFSTNDGGVICDKCLPHSQVAVIKLSVTGLRLIKLAIYSRYEELLQMLANCANPLLLSQLLMPIAKEMMVVHLGIQLKSLQFFNTHAQQG